MKEPDSTRRAEFYRGLHYVANIVRTECQQAKVPLVLSGDLHHYSRYKAADTGTTFITAGGGGAFLHPTHHLKDSINFKWILRKQHLDLQKDRTTGDVACYPSREKSRQLAWGNWKFVIKNPDFFVTLGGLYWIAGLIILAWRGYRSSPAGASLLDRIWEQILFITPTPVFILTALAFVGGIIHYADIRPLRTKYVVGGLHALVHVFILTAGTALFSTLLSPYLEDSGGELIYFALFAVCMTVGAGLLGGIVWGLYLLAASWVWAMHANDSFSAMRLNTFRHFLRIRIEGDKVEVFPIGIDETPPMDQWTFAHRPNPEDQNISVLQPKRALGQHLIESSIEIDVTQVRALE